MIEFIPPSRDQGAEDVIVGLFRALQRFVINAEPVAAYLRAHPRKNDQVERLARLSQFMLLAGDFVIAMKLEQEAAAILLNRQQGKEPERAVTKRLQGAGVRIAETPVGPIGFDEHGWPVGFGKSET